MKIILSALAGLLLGVGATALVVKQTVGKTFDNQYLISVMDQANVALHIRSEKQMALLSNIETALPNYALVVDRDFRGHAAATDALWMIKAYYERNQIAYPSEIKGIMDSLPPKPPTSCQMRLRMLDDTSVNTTNIKP